MTDPETAARLARKLIAEMPGIVQGNRRDEATLSRALLRIIRDRGAEAVERAITHATTEQFWQMTLARPTDFINHFDTITHQAEVKAAQAPKPLDAWRITTAAYRAAKAIAKPPDRFDGFQAVLDAHGAHPHLRAAAERVYPILGTWTADSARTRFYEIYAGAADA